MLKYATRLRGKFKNVLTLVNAKDSEMTGEQFLNNFQDLIVDSGDTDIQFGPSTYLDFYNKMYKHEPLQSSEGWLIDLYRVD